MSYWKAVAIFLSKIIPLKFFLMMKVILQLDGLIALFRIYWLLLLELYVFH